MIGRGDAPQFVSNQVGEKQRKILRDVANNFVAIIDAGYRFGLSVFSHAFLARGDCTL